MFSRSFTQKEIQQNQPKHRQIRPQIHFATLTCDNQIKPVHYLAKHEKVLPSQKVDCHPILADFGNDQFSMSIIDNGENIRIKPLDSFSFEAVEPFQSQYKRTIMKNTEKKSKESAILNGIDMTDNDILNIAYQKIMTFFP